jgi:hypothetical protein
MSFVRGVAGLAIAAVALAGCGGGVVSPSPTYTAVPIGPTAWPSGTTGQYGLRIDPSLLGKLPAHAGALPITEDAGSESTVLDDPDAAKTLDRFVAASAGDISDPDWVNISIGLDRSIREGRLLAGRTRDGHQPGADWRLHGRRIHVWRWSYGLHAPARRLGRGLDV